MELGNDLRVFITGANGYAGSHIVRTLNASGISPLCLLRQTSNTERLSGCRYRVIFGDMRDLLALQNAVSEVDAVIHVAGVVNARSKATYFDVNQKGAVNLVDAISSHGKCVRTVIIISSQAAGGPNLSADQLRTESTPDTPVSWYGESKRQGGLEFARLSDNIRTVVLRPPLIIGGGKTGGDNPALAMTLAFLKIGIAFRFGLKSMSVISVSDLAHAVKMALESEHARGTYYVASRQNISEHELFATMAQALNSRVWLSIPIPRLILALIGVFMDQMGHLLQKDFPFCSDKVKDLTAPHWGVDCSKARRDFASLN